MSKRITTLGLALPPRGEGVPAQRWLGNALREEILSGRLRPGARLPATRDLARQVGLSRGTIVSAFDRLKAEGYLEGSVGSGTYVRQVLPDELLTVGRNRNARAPRLRGAQRTLSQTAKRVRAFPAHDTRAIRSFRANIPALDLFPTSLWAQIASRRARNASMSQLLGTDTLGYAPLRDAVADYLRSARGVKCDASQIVIVSGMQEALDLATRLVVDPGDAVCTEDPCYVGASRIFDTYGAKVVPQRVDAEGMEIPPAHHRSIRLVYVTPAHQLPLGISMTLPRRLQLLEWARTSGAMIFEDDYDSEYRYVGRPLPALQGLDQHGVVMYASSFSKTLFPALRLGYLVLPPDLVEPVAAIKSITNRHAPVFEQVILSEFLSEGHFGRHVRRMREIYAQRREVLIDAARARLRGLFEISGIEAGLQTSGWLTEGITGAAAKVAAERRNIDVLPLSALYRAPALREGLLLGFAAIDPPEIERGVRDLAMALEECRAELRSRRSRKS